jgi:hypothetical protein
MSDLLFFTRKTCSLCADAHPVVLAVAARRRHTVETIDVDDTGLADRFGDRVPVVLRDGREVLAGRFDRRAVRRALR